jgi:TonB family protein
VTTKASDDLQAIFGIPLLMKSHYTGAVLSAYKIVALSLICVSFACCQTADTALKDLRSRTKGRSFILKSLSAQESIRYHRSGDELEPDAPPEMKVVGLFSPTQTALSGTVLTIRGDRRDILLDPNTSKPIASPFSVEVAIEIDLGMQDVATFLPTLESKLYFPNVHAALEAVPEYLRSIVPERLVAKGMSPAPCNPCIQWIRQGAWQEISADHKVKAPELTGGMEVRMTDAAKAAGVAADVRIAYVIDEEGHTTEIWLTHSAGYGLDESALDHAQHERFRPAMYQGAPIAVRTKEVIHFALH